MCGIAGIIRQPHNSLAEQIAAMIQQGPDDERLYVEPEALVALKNRQTVGCDQSLASPLSMHTTKRLTSITTTVKHYNAASYYKCDILEHYYHKR